MLNVQTASDAKIVEEGWGAVARGDWDTLVNDYTDDLIFAMPGQIHQRHNPLISRRARRRRSPHFFQVFLKKPGQFVK